MIYDTWQHIFYDAYGHRLYGAYVLRIYDVYGHRVYDAYGHRLYDVYGHRFYDGHPQVCIYVELLSLRMERVAAIWLVDQVASPCKLPTAL